MQHSLIMTQSKQHMVNQQVVIVAGEESGDMHAAQLIKELKRQDPHLVISGIGGKHMQQAGAMLVCDLASYGVTGLTEVFRHLCVLKQAMTQIKNHLRNTKPDLLILVDYPGFNLRLATFAKQTLGLRIIYYISPQIWAWKAKRLATIRQNIDHMAVILPFEKKIYEEGHVPVSFVGHPLVLHLQKSTPARAPQPRGGLQQQITIQEPLIRPSDTFSPGPGRRETEGSYSEEGRKLLGLPLNLKMIALLPGSRGHEIERHMHVFMKTARRLSQQHSNLHFVIPVAKTLAMDTVRRYIPKELNNISLIDGQAVDVITSSDCVVVASGTASLECALLGKPMCIVYKASWLSYLVAVKVIK